jgi:hypothetical protein
MAVLGVAAVALVVKDKMFLMRDNQLVELLALVSLGL